MSELRSMIADLLKGQKEMSAKLGEQSKQIEEQTEQIKDLKKENVELRSKNTIMAAQLEHLKSEKPEKRKKMSNSSSQESILSIEVSDSDMEQDDPLDENSASPQKFFKTPKKKEKGKKKKG
jgi:predicted RNase H-like nuclease (RuvC/YqgF family)